MVFFFKDGTDLLRDVEVGALGRFLVVTDVIGQSVLELASSDVRVEGAWHGLLGDAGRCKGSNGHDG